MKLGPIVLKLRAANTRFGNRIAGAAELAVALEGTLLQETAFVIHLTDDAAPNEHDTDVVQKVTERFAVVAAIRSDVSDSDKLGITAYDAVHDVRAELWSCLLGWLIDGTDTLVYYGGGRLVDFDRSYLWYQFEFVSALHIEQSEQPGPTDWLDAIYADWELSPSANLPIIESLPVSLFTPDMNTIVDFTNNPAIDGGFDRGFNGVFDVYQG